MKALIQVPIVTSVLLCSALPLSHNLAASSSPAMETLVVTYRNPADYALYTYTTEMLSVFRLEIREDISIQAHNGLMEMAKAQHSQHRELTQMPFRPIHLASLWLSQTPPIGE